MVEKKPKLKQQEAVNLWNQEAAPITMKKFRETAYTEKLLLFGETGSGKTQMYLDILPYLLETEFPVKDVLMNIILPDRPTGVSKLCGLVPNEFIDDDRVNIFPVSDYETTIVATATSDKLLRKHFRETGKLGYAVFELMENYWTFSQDYFSRQAYGQNLGEFFAQMQNIMGEEKGDKKAAYEAFAGPYGGPWPIIKFFHNFNWIDRIKRFPYHTIFTSEIKEETNKDSIFFEYGYRPAGEKHNQHKMDEVILTSHVKDKFFIKPYKLTGYTALYNKLDVTNKNAYKEHLDAKKKLEDRGFRVSPIKDIEKQAGIKPPTLKKKEQPKKVEEKKEPEDDEWNL